MDDGEAAANGDHFSSSPKKSLQSSHERQISFGDCNAVNDSLFNSTTQNTMLRQYSQHLPRRRGYGRKAIEGCGGMSSASWIFLLLGLLQCLIVAGLQITISMFGGFRQARLEDYVECLESTIVNELEIINSTFSIPNNTAFPTFGEDKEIYIYFFLLVVFYNFLLCVYALKQQNIVEVYAFMVLNVLAMVYACMQVYQFRGFGMDCSLITKAGYIALANAIVLLVFTVIFMILSLGIYKEFGWKTYRLLDCDPAMRYYHRVYEILMSAVKILLLFMFMFSIGQCILILTPENYEFPLTIVMAFAILFVVYPVIYLVVTNEFILGYIGMFITVFLVGAYCVFKISRYVSLSCPLCRVRVAEVKLQQNIIINETVAEGLPTNVSDQLIRLLNLDRVEDFGNLTMLASLCLVFSIFATIVFIHHLRFYNKGLRQYFYNQQPNNYLNTHCFRTCHRYRTRYDVTDAPMKGNTLVMRGVGSKISQKSTRDSGIEEIITASPTMPDQGFNEALPTVPGYTPETSNYTAAVRVPPFKRQ